MKKEENRKTGKRTAKDAKNAKRTGEIEEAVRHDAEVWEEAKGKVERGNGPVRSVRKAVREKWQPGDLVEKDPKSGRFRKYRGMRKEKRRCGRMMRSIDRC